VVKILGDMKREGYSDCTVHHVLKLIRRVYNWSVENGYYFENNPCNTIKSPKYDNRVTDYLTTKEVAELVDHIKSWDNYRAANVILFALFTGRRKGEITNLEWRDVDFENRTITCRQTKNGRTLSFPLNEKAFAVIVDASKNKISKYVFPSSTGHNYYHGFSLAWARLKKRIDLDHRFHNLRHTFASHLASSGKVDIYTLKTLLGHQDISLTMRYAHLSNEAIRNANMVIDEIF
jgi:integrase